ncbi:hypothetical protein [Hyphomicrobium sp. ghe19]|uniref:hypothetical protein n=1 Tax=Hyphomicrobium sp. ghe19 TaxID=2682968 RepID=UPI0013677CD6|nr:hypothetical protein HYPP_01968 [Hyphomicrobium sp. ghe19]
MLDKLIHKCPTCDGVGSLVAFINRGSDIATHSLEDIVCSTCGGEGRISDKRAMRISIGKAHRDIRVARCQSLLEAAREQGMGPAELSACEHGRGPDDWYRAVEASFPASPVFSGA